MGGFSAFAPGNEAAPYCRSSCFEARCDCDEQRLPCSSGVGRWWWRHLREGGPIVGQTISGGRRGDVDVHLRIEIAPLVERAGLDDDKRSVGGGAPERGSARRAKCP